MNLIHALQSSNMTTIHVIFLNPDYNQPPEVPVVSPISAEKDESLHSDQIEWKYKQDLWPTTPYVFPY